MSGAAEKEYEHLSKSAQTKIRKKLLSLQEEPYAGKKLTGELSGIRTVRAWPYRILYEVNVQEGRVEVHKIVHRQRAYK